MDYLLGIINDYTLEFVFGSVIIAFISFSLVCMNFFRTNKIIRKYKRLMRGSDNKNLEAMLYTHLDTIQGSLTRLKDLELNLSTIISRLDGCLQRIGTIRYNAFDQMGGDQSFSIALLDELGNGFVLTGLYGRNASTTFAKPIHLKQSKYPLSAEESQAIQRAFQSK